MFKIMTFVAGLVLVFGAVGTLESDPNAAVLAQILLALVGLVMMAWSVPLLQETQGEIDS
jgi:uncharacterized membrane protein